jgi:hypothetical protein
LFRESLDQGDRRFQVHPQDARALRVGVLADGDGVLHAGVVDEDVDLAERVDQRRDAPQVGQVVGDLALQVQLQDAYAGLLQRGGARLADAARGAGDERGDHASPGMEKPLCFNSVINCSS